MNTYITASQTLSLLDSDGFLTLTFSFDYKPVPANASTTNREIFAKGDFRVSVDTSLLVHIIISGADVAFANPLTSIFK